MKNWMMVFIFICLIIPFQNCSKTSGLSSEGTQSSASTSDEATSPLLPAQAQSIEMPLQVVAKAADSSSPSHVLLYPKTGIIDAFLPSGDVASSEHYCLKSEQIATLEGLLSAAKICEAQDRSQDGQTVCTMEYRSPYAKLNFGDQSISLGERLSGCKIGTDLCGSSSKNLQNFLMDVIANLQNLKCDIQDL